MLKFWKDSSFWDNVLKLSLSKLNYGNGQDLTESGELNALIQIRNTHFNHQEKLILFDIGANIGNYSLKLTEILHNQPNEIYAFEPSEITFHQLHNNVKNHTNIICKNFGFNDTESVSTLYTNQSGSGIASIYQRNLEHFGLSLNKSESIVLKTIDNFCDEEKIEKIDLLKLDIEGHELKALHGASNMIAKGKINIIQFEFGGCNIDSRTFFQDFYYLLQPQYNIYRILKNNLLLIENYNESLEIFLTTNYLAIKK